MHQKRFLFFILETSHNLALKNRIKRETAIIKQKKSKNKQNKQTILETFLPASVNNLKSFLLNVLCLLLDHFRFLVLIWRDGSKWNAVIYVPTTLGFFYYYGTCLKRMCQVEFMTYLMTLHGCYDKYQLFRLVATIMSFIHKFILSGTIVHFDQLGLIGFFSQS